MLLIRMARCTVIALASSMLPAVNAYADATARDAAAGETGPRLYEVVVTAQRRTENLQDVPVSVQVINGQTLGEQNHNTLEDLIRTVPGVHVSGSSFSNLIFIRGVGSGDNASFDQSVAMFVDDIYHGRSRMSAATFLDLDRIEVLKGPQSTFFGNNAIAGALNIVSRKPGSTFEAETRAVYGEFGQYALEGAMGGPLTDTFGARLAVTRNGVSEGWIHNVNLGADSSRTNNVAGRLTLDFHPSDAMDATMKIEGSRQRIAGRINQYGECPPPAPYAPGSVGSGGACAQALALGGVPMGFDTDENVGLPGQGSRLSTFEDVLTINYGKWGHTLTSVSGFYNYHFESKEDVGNLPVDTIATVGFPENYHQISQELRIASAVDQPIEYLAGVYFQTDRLEWTQNWTIPLLNFVPAALGLPELAPYLPMGFKTAFLQDEDVYSVFGSLRWKVTDRLKLNAGLRGSWQKKDFTEELHYGTSTQRYGSDFVPLPPALEPLWAPILAYGPPGTRGSDRSERAWMPSGGIQYQVHPEAMLYLTYARGFKAGGFNGQGSLAEQSTGYGPEHVNAYELGLKSKWFDDRLLLDLDVFRSDYKGLQVPGAIFQPATNTNVFFIGNAAKSRSQGVELETQWVVSRDFRLAANVTYLDSQYVSYPTAPRTTLENVCAGSADPYCLARFPAGVPQLHDSSGQRTLYAPLWSGSVTASHSMPLPGDYRVTTELMSYFTSSYNDDPDGLFRGLGNYVRLDAKLTLAQPDRRWAVDLIGKNLTDRTILTWYGPPIYTKERGRNVAVQFRYKW